MGHVPLRRLRFNSRLHPAGRPSVFPDSTGQFIGTRVMATLKETREIPVQDVIIRLADLKLIAGHLFSEHENTSNNNQSNFEIKIVREDGVSFESQSLSILDDDSPVLDQKLISIEIIFSNFDKQRSIKIEFHHGNWVKSRV
jgi:hypothetical protein